MMHKSKAKVYFVIQLVLWLGLTASSYDLRAESLEALRAKLQALEACQRSIEDELCNLKILDPSLQDLLRQLDQSKNRKNSDRINSMVTAGDCYPTSIRSPSPFMGNHGELVKLGDGSVWEVQFEYECMYEYYPSAVACPSQAMLIVNDKKISANLLGSPNSAIQSGNSVIESYIENDFQGLNSGNLYKLSNGQIWEQIEPWVWVWVWVRPEVIIYRTRGVYKMKVEGIDHAVTVRRVR